MQQDSKADDDFRIEGGVKFLKYVRHEHVAAHEADGWVVCEGNNLKGTHHGDYSVFMERKR